jgi:hypothetical protein
VVALVEKLQLYSPAGPAHPYAALIERHIRDLCTVHSIKKVLSLSSHTLPCTPWSAHSVVANTTAVTQFAIRRDVLHNLSQVAQLLLERANLLVPEDGVRGIYHALLLLCKTYSKPHAYLTHAHSKTPLHRSLSLSRARALP